MRQLAAYGMVVDAADRGTRRERWWQAAHTTTTWEPDELLQQPGGLEANELGNLVLPRLAEAADLETAFLVVGAVVLLSALLCLRLPRSTAEPALWTGSSEPDSAVPSSDGHA